MRQRWTLDDLRPLRPLLHEAKISGRLVIVTADHGHVLDTGTEMRSGGEGDRWRTPGTALGEGEIQMAKGRVLTPGGAEIVVMPWTEDIRYAGKKNGYHGGATPQEVLVPLAGFSGGLVNVEGWDFAPPTQPDWWEPATVSPPAVAPSPPVAPKKRKPKKDAAQASLFDMEAPASAPPAGGSGDWIDRLLASPTWGAQKKLVSRGVPGDDEIRRLLATLSDRGGKMTRTALAQALGLPAMRISGFVRKIGSLLNVDQAPVLDIDEASDTVSLNRGLLETQFMLRG